MDLRREIEQSVADDADADADANAEESEARRRTEEAKIDQPVLLYLLFVQRGTLPSAAEAVGRRNGKHPYTHQQSQLDCVPWNKATVLGLGTVSPTASPVFLSRRRRTMAGPRTMELFPRYADHDNNRPVDFHFLENYHYLCQTAESPQRALSPAEEHTVWWPNVVVRLEEVYRAVRRLSMDDLAGASKFFGYLARPGVRLQRYWVLLDDKPLHQIMLDPVPGTPPRDMDEAYERGSAEDKSWELLMQLAVDETAFPRTPGDLVAVSGVDALRDRDKRRLRTVAGYLGAWGRSAPVQPRVVRWAKEGEKVVEDEEDEEEGRRREPSTVLELAEELEKQEARRGGLKMFPDICFR
ncbi:hypothetical protein M426DRAFT_17140 [Hypoxylon sp. CI-4A]|nr:hypothetical protein M426DRAFT_17140 [Hypoxylon sp. CI-4A]